MGVEDAAEVVVVVVVGDPVKVGARRLSFGGAEAVPGGKDPLGHDVTQILSAVK